MLKWWGRNDINKVRKFSENLNCLQPHSPFPLLARGKKTLLTISKKSSYCLFLKYGLQTVAAYYFIKNNVFFEKQKDTTNLQVQRYLLKISTIMEKI